MDEAMGLQLGGGTDRPGPGQGSCGLTPEGSLRAGASPQLRTPTRACFL